MVIVLKKDITKEQHDNLRKFLTSKNFKLNEIVGTEDTIIAAVGKVSMDINDVALIPGVANVIPISRPYKMASREFKKENTVIELKNSRGQVVRIGGQRIVVGAGPSAVESREQIMEIARRVAKSGAVMLRGGTYKPRSSPYSFQGLGAEGLALLKEAGERYGLPIVTEIASETLIPVMKDVVDVFQIGSRNMQNFDLLKRVGALGKPVILKRSYTATIEEFLMSAEYLLSSGTDNVILCERGIRTFEHATRNTLDISAIPVLRALTHLPIIVDPSPAVGVRERVAPMALAALAAGADGVIVEVHNNPEKALSAGAESILPVQFDKMVHDIEALASIVGKSVVHIRERPGQVAASEERGGAAQAKIVCAYSGSRGAYADQAISRYFDSADVVAKPLDSFDEIFQSVTDGTADYGMVPIENSLAGSVFQNYDNFIRFEDVRIVGAVTLNIRHALLGVKGASLSDIRNVYSHPQALSQCKRFLDSHKGWNLVDSVSTASACELVAERRARENAAIASSLNADIYKLDVLADDIEDDPGNFTRFVVIQGNRAEAPEAAGAAGRRGAGEVNILPNMASFIFKTKNEPGALYNVLGVFNDCRLNMTRLESHPIAGQPWRYWFYADAEIKSDDAEGYVRHLMGLLSDKVEEIRLLGVYSEQGK